MSPKILVVDDEQNMLKLLEKVLIKAGYGVRTAGTAANALKAMEEESFHLIISDLIMPGIGGMDLMNQVKSRHPDVPFVVVTAYGTVESAVEAMKGGAFDYLTKPFQKDHILLVVDKALKYCRLHDEVRRLRRQLDIKGMAQIIGKSKAMEGVLNLVGKIADSQATVLVRGESGTGKELVAGAIHKLSSRRDKPFVAVDCSVLPEQLLQSELFGHVKGSFTGAVKDKEGLFLAADGGTIFLDEIGTIAPSVQLNLLRVLQEKEIKPVGSVTKKNVDVRVVAATNEDLERAMVNATFRRDLYYRLAVVTVDVPPLRKRIDDIAPLTHHFMHKYAKLYHKNVADITPQTMRALMAYSWPGNVRELENVMERAVLLSPGPLIDESSLAFPASRQETSAPVAETMPTLKNTTRAVARERERGAIIEALKTTRGNKTRAAKSLCISRTSLYNKMKELGIQD